MGKMMDYKMMVFVLKLGMEIGKTLIPICKMVTFEQKCDIINPKKIRGFLKIRTFWKMEIS